MPGQGVKSRSLVEASDSAPRYAHNNGYVSTAREPVTVALESLRLRLGVIPPTASAAPGNVCRVSASWHRAVCGESSLVADRSAMAHSGRSAEVTPVRCDNEQ